MIVFDKNFNFSNKTMLARNTIMLASTFADLHAKILLSAESICWPDSLMETQYPVHHESDLINKFLNSGGRYSTILKYNRICDILLYVTLLNSRKSG